MTSSQIRQSFLDFFKSKQHTIVPSSSLMPDSPNLLFTNAGMNQFVPIFLGQVKCPYTPGRAADTQKCIRAGGKHNDLEDVGLDTYHHTFFEMLGNWSFGDYFKKEAIEWAWELVVGVWKFPPQRLYATVFCPQNYFSRWDSELDSALKLVEIGPTVAQQDVPLTGGASKLPDREAIQYWIRVFQKANLDPREHIIPGSFKDNFWMMGETGPCGPCSELHVDLTPAGDTKGSLVNKGDARCIEIWNLVFIQFNANPDGTFSPLPAKHVDTGMGFERVTSIIQGTKGLTDFANAKISNYETDIFRPIFDKLEDLSGKKYGSTLPGVTPTPAAPLKTSGEAPSNIVEIDGSVKTQPIVADDHRRDPSGTIGIASAEQIALDIAFRVIADHIRTLSFAIADGIQPGNNDRNYVLRRILRRAVRYGRTLGFKEPFFYKLVDVLADTMGDVFPTIRARKKNVQDVIRTEEEAFNKTLDRGIELFEQAMRLAPEAKLDSKISGSTLAVDFKDDIAVGVFEIWRDASGKEVKMLSGELAFKLYDTYGFPLDLTELMARERGLPVNVSTFNELMEDQRTRARAAQKKEVISLSQIETTTPTKFVGFEKLETPAKVLEVVSLKDKTAIILDESTFYAEMGGQVGDTGEIILNPVAADVRRRTPDATAESASSPRRLQITNTQKSGNTWLHFLETEDLKLETPPAVNSTVTLSVDQPRRNAIQRHHTVTHLLHWALHEVVSKEASQKGSFVGPDKLTFDFNSAPLTPQQVADIEKLVNERIVENAGVSWTEVPYADVKSRKDVMQFFGDKYGDVVRVVQIGGRAGDLDGYSMELCGGTHTRATGEIGLFRIVGENAIAAGVRRIEALAGLEAYRKATDELALIKLLAGKVNSPVHELEKKIEALLEHQKEMEKQIKVTQQREASNAASRLLEEIQTVNGMPAIIHNLGGVDGDFLQAVADSLKSRFKGVIVLGGGSHRGSVALIAAVTPEFTGRIQAGKIIQQIAPIVGGKGGGKPDNARGGGKDADKLDEALAKAKTLLG